MRPRNPNFLSHNASVIENKATEVAMFISCSFFLCRVTIDKLVLDACMVSCAVRSFFHGWRRKCPVFLVQFIFFPVTYFTITNYPRTKMSSFFCQVTFFPTNENVQSHDKCPVSFWKTSSSSLSISHFAFRAIYFLKLKLFSFRISHFAQTDFPDICWIPFSISHFALRTILFLKGR